MPHSSNPKVMFTQVDFNVLMSTIDVAKGRMSKAQMLHLSDSLYDELRQRRGEGWMRSFSDGEVVAGAPVGLATATAA